MLPNALIGWQCDCVSFMKYNCTVGNIQVLKNIIVISPYNSGATVQ